MTTTGTLKEKKKIEQPPPVFFIVNTKWSNFFFIHQTQCFYRKGVFINTNRVFCHHLFCGHFVEIIFFLIKSSYLTISNNSGCLLFIIRKAFLYLYFRLTDNYVLLKMFELTVLWWGSVLFSIPFHNRCHLSVTFGILHVTFYFSLIQY